MMTDDVADSLESEDNRNRRRGERRAEAREIAANQRRDDRRKAKPGITGLIRALFGKDS